MKVTEFTSRDGPEVNYFEAIFCLREAGGKFKFSPPWDKISILLQGVSSVTSLKNWDNETRQYNDKKQTPQTTTRQIELIIRTQ